METGKCYLVSVDIMMDRIKGNRNVIFLSWCIILQTVLYYIISVPKSRCFPELHISKCKSTHNNISFYIVFAEYKRHFSLLYKRGLTLLQVKVEKLRDSLFKFYKSNIPSSPHG